MKITITSKTTVNSCKVNVPQKLIEIDRITISDYQAKKIRNAIPEIKMNTYDVPNRSWIWRDDVENIEELEPVFEI